MEDLSNQSDHPNLYQSIQLHLSLTSQSDIPSHTVFPKQFPTVVGFPGLTAHPVWHLPQYEALLNEYSHQIAQEYSLLHDELLWEDISSDVTSGRWSACYLMEEGHSCEILCKLPACEAVLNALPLMRCGSVGVD